MRCVGRMCSLRIVSAAAAFSLVAAAEASHAAGAPWAAANSEWTSPVQRAAFELGERKTLAAIPDEIEPRIVLKASAGKSAIDRTGKGDLVNGLRPSLDSNL